MSRKFGDYIHLHWQNYYDHGTLRNSEKNTNYTASLFEQHYNQIKESIKKLSIDPVKRKTIVQEYNKRNQEAWDLFQSLVKDDQTKANNFSILQHLLKTINNQWTDDFIREIIVGLKWDDTLDTFVYTPTGQQSGHRYKTSITGWPALRINIAGEFHEFKTLAKYINVAKQYLTTLKDSPAAEKDLLTLQKMSTNIVKQELKLKNWEKSERQLWNMTKNQSASTEQQRFVKNVLSKMLNNQAKVLNAMREKYVDAEEINRQIQAAMAEIFGNIVADQSMAEAKQALKDEITKALSVGKTGSTSITVPSNAIMSLSSKAVEVDFAANPSAFKVLKKNGKTADGKIKYAFTDIGQSRAQKRDVTLTIGADNYGISVKNTDITNAYLNYDNKKGKQPASTISLQNSSLMLFLMGMEQTNPGIGTHYLNALSQHVDTAGLTYTQFEALQSLKLYILYSALTGRGQLRSSSGAAQILAIYDKAKNSPSRVRLYDMSDIALAIEESQFTKGVKFSPSIDANFLLKNEKVDAVQVKEDGWRQPIEMRLTNVLLEARRKNVSTSIYTAWLRDSLQAF